MDSTTALLIAIPVLVVLAGVMLFASARRRDTGEAIGALARETRKRDRGAVDVVDGDDAPPTTGREVERAAALERRESGKGLATVGATAPVAWVPPDPEALDVSRRQFMNRGIVTFFGLGLAGFGGSVLAFLWPQLSGGFGSEINIGSTTDVDAKIAEGQGFAYYPEGRMWVTHYPSAALGAARLVYSPPELKGMEEGYTALYQKCVHLGCRVPQCLSSQWFECQCHGSQYNRNGEKKGGPAPRGLDRFGLAVSSGSVTVNTAVIIQGPPIGTNTTGQEAEGPHCVGGGEH
jgi:cytochrome b6-f complex iron-sulfur subunit